MWLRSSLLAGLTVSAVVGATGFLGIHSASAERSSVNRQECVDSHLREKMIVWYTNMPGAVGVPLGFESLGFDDILDDSGQVVAKAAYSMDVIKKQPDGSLIAHLAEQIHFQDGAILFTGTFDRTAMFAGAWATQKVEGISGRYLGWTGTYVWRFEAPMTDPANPPAFEVNLHMCRH
jgi:hypothetical protein